MPSGILISFLGALQASFSVLLTISSGVIAAQFNLISTEAAEEVSSLCVKLLLPCLLISSLGSELHLDTVIRYVPIIIWAAVYTVLSIATANVVAAVFRLPKWVVTVTSFNNTESLPLLLLQALSTTGVLASLVGPGGEDDGIERARSYFLACSVITNTITFGQGPQILTTSPHDSTVMKAFRWITSRRKPSHQDEPEDSESQRTQIDGRTGRKVRDSVSSRFGQCFDAAPKPVQKTLEALRTFINPPLVGAFIGVIIGIAPPLQHLFFNDMDNGGYFNAWLTKALKNVGELFVALQVVVVGVKLSLSLRMWKKGKEAGSIPLGTLVCVVVVRFILWPAISIPLIWALASRTGLLTDDPMLWWAMMMMPVGPPAMKNLALADVSGTDQKTRMSIAKFLTLSYMITPIVSIAVVGALSAAEAAKN
ncbi:hypothetical protein DL766_005264 [Monosporascus sp. MC13-8B]|nr:hypothetical protein DL763_006194 [Monosporascus cannonballus]RYP29634.1 hypothetical protein DL766_005264 [Monosporascus sp. MC13-8B]